MLFICLSLHECVAVPTVDQLLPHTHTHANKQMKYSRNGNITYKYKYKKYHFRLKPDIDFLPSLCVASLHFFPVFLFFYIFQSSLLLSLDFFCSFFTLLLHSQIVNKSRSCLNLQQTDKKQKLRSNYSSEMRKKKKIWNSCIRKKGKTVENKTGKYLA